MTGIGSQNPVPGQYSPGGKDPTVPGGTSQPPMAGVKSQNPVRADWHHKLGISYSELVLFGKCVYFFGLKRPILLLSEIGIQFLWVKNFNNVSNSKHKNNKILCNDLKVSLQSSKHKNS